jgi:hypothetical protein
MEQIKKIKSLYKTLHTNNTDQPSETTILPQGIKNTLDKKYKILQEEYKILQEEYKRLKKENEQYKKIFKEKIFIHKPKYIEKLDETYYPPQAF